MVVVNTSATNNEHSGLRVDAREHVPELGRKLVNLWVVGWHKDSFELLYDYLNAVPKGELHVLKMPIYGTDRNYERYSKI